MTSCESDYTLGNPRNVERLSLFLSRVIGTRRPQFTKMRPIIGLQFLVHTLLAALCFVLGVHLAVQDAKKQVEYRVDYSPICIPPWDGLNMVLYISIGLTMATR